MMRRDLQSVTVLRGESKASGYVGSELEYKEIGVIKAQVSPVSDSFTVDNFGRRRAAGYQLNCDKRSDIKDGDKIVLFGEQYRVSSVLRYSDFITVTVEKDGAYNG